MEIKIKTTTINKIKVGDELVGKRKETGLGRWGQWVKSLLYKHESLSLDLLYSDIMLRVVVHTSTGGKVGGS